MPPSESDMCGFPPNDEQHAPCTPNQPLFNRKRSRSLSPTTSGTQSKKRLRTSKPTPGALRPLSSIQRIRLWARKQKRKKLALVSSRAFSFPSPLPPLSTSALQLNDTTTQGSEQDVVTQEENAGSSSQPQEWETWNGIGESAKVVSGNLPMHNDAGVAAIIIHSPIATTSPIIPNLTISSPTLYALQRPEVDLDGAILEPTTSQSMAANKTTSTRTLDADVKRTRRHKELESKRKQHDAINFLNSLKAQRKKRDMKFQLSKPQTPASSRQEHPPESLNIDLETDKAKNGEPESSFISPSHDADVISSPASQPLSVFEDFPPNPNNAVLPTADSRQEHPHDADVISPSASQPVSVFQDFPPNTNNAVLPTADSRQEHPPKSLETDKAKNGEPESSFINPSHDADVMSSSTSQPVSIVEAFPPNTNDAVLPTADHTDHCDNSLNLRDHVNPLHFSEITPASASSQTILTIDHDLPEYHHSSSEMVPVCVQPGEDHTQVAIATTILDPSAPELKQPKVHKDIKSSEHKHKHKQRDPIGLTYRWKAHKKKNLIRFKQGKTKAFVDFSQLHSSELPVLNEDDAHTDETETGSSVVDAMLIPDIDHTLADGSRVFGINKGKRKADPQHSEDDLLPSTVSEDAIYPRIDKGKQKAAAWLQTDDLKDDDFQATSPTITLLEHPAAEQRSSNPSQSRPQLPEMACSAGGNDEDADDEMGSDGGGSDEENGENEENCEGKDELGSDSDLPNAIRRNTEWCATYQHLKQNPNKHHANRSLAVVMEMVAEISPRCARLRKDVTPSESTSDSDRAPLPSNKTGSRYLHVRREDNDLKGDVRSLARVLLHYPEDLKVPSRLELERFELFKIDENGPQIDDLLLDLGSKGVNSFWNKRASEIFAAKFVSEGTSAHTNLKAIQKAFMVHLQTLQRQYKRQECGSDIDETVKIEELDHRSQASRLGRMRYLFKRRLDTAKHFSKDSRMLEVVRTVWSKLHPEAMSEDESGVDEKSGEPQYIVRNPYWRNPEVTEFFRIHDYLYFSTRFTTNNRITPGRFPHSRTPSNRKDKDRPAIRGLPENFYNPSWLAALTPLEKHMLKIQPKVDLSFPPGILRIAARFAGVKNRKSVPLIRNHPTLGAYMKPSPSLAISVQLVPVATPSRPNSSKIFEEYPPVAGPSKRKPNGSK